MVRQQKCCEGVRIYVDRLFFLDSQIGLLNEICTNRAYLSQSMQSLKSTITDLRTKIDKNICNVKTRINNNNKKID